MKKLKALSNADVQAKTTILENIIELFAKNGIEIDEIGYVGSKDNEAGMIAVQYNGQRATCDVSGKEYSAHAVYEHLVGQLDTDDSEVVTANMTVKELLSIIYPDCSTKKALGVAGMQLSLLSHILSDMEDSEEE